MGSGKTSKAGISGIVAAFVRYTLAGGMGFVLDYAVLTICYEALGVHYLTSSALGFMVGLVFVYISSNKWVFASRRMENKMWLEFIIFFVIGIMGLGFTMLFMYLFVDVIHIHPLISKLFTTALVLLWNFSARKIILYS